MLLPSALPCDTYSGPSPSYHAQSPPLSLHSASSPRLTTNIQTTCHALQSLLATSNPAQPRPSIAIPPLARRIQSPEARRPLLESPIAITPSTSPHPSRLPSRSRLPLIQGHMVINFNAPDPPSQPSSRTRPSLTRSSIAANAPSQLAFRVRPPLLRSPIAIVPRVKKQRQPQLQSPPRGATKRRRSLVDEMDNRGSHRASIPTAPLNFAPSTPKRRRLLPPSLPRGLDRADFDALQLHPTEIETRPTAAIRKACSCCCSAPKSFSPNPLAITTPPVLPSSPDIFTDEEVGVLCAWSDTVETEAYLLTLILPNLRLRQYEWKERAKRGGTRWKMD